MEEIEEMSQKDDSSPANGSYKINSYYKKKPKRLPWNIDVPKDHFIPQTYQVKLFKKTPKILQNYCFFKIFNRYN